MADGMARPSFVCDEDDYENEIFSIFNNKVVRTWTKVILAGKRDNNRHSTTNFSKNVVVFWETGDQMLQVLPFCDPETA